MTQSIFPLRQARCSELACQFAAFIERLDNSANALVALTAGWLTETISQGNVCLNLKQPELPLELREYFPADVMAWQDTLRASNVIGQPGDFKPLILNRQGQLYLYRLWHDEMNVAAAFKQRSQMAVDYQPEQLIAHFLQWQSSIGGIDWQKVAVLSALTQGLSIISGGPGTGKTTIIRTIITLLSQLDVQSRIVLAAPTGKAAARLQQSVQAGSYPVEAKTLHRLLGITPENEQGHYSPEQPLPVDVLIVDEASMIDISLMAKLLAALPAKARLILLGDSQQLASVESGAVLASLCSQSVQFSADFAALAEQCGVVGLPISGLPAVLTNQLVQLQHNYRFVAHSLIGQLADKVNEGDLAAVWQLIEQATEPFFFKADEKNLLVHLQSGYQAYIAAVEQRQSAQQILTAFESYRVLAALRQGVQSVNGVNMLMHRYLAQRGWHTQQNFYHGRPLMVTQNDYRQQLFNGDIGVVLSDENGQLKACFGIDETVRYVPLNRLPAYETAFAMTVHKSQGSEFKHVTILLPDASPLLNRELLYTAISRARKSLSILGSYDSLKQAVTSRHQRESGLKQQLSQAFMQ